MAAVTTSYNDTAIPYPSSVKAIRSAAASLWRSLAAPIREEEALS